MQKALLVQSLFIVTEETVDDNIYKAAVEFNKLMSYEYKFVVGAKGRNTEIALRFDEHNFHHLCGLHKLQDVIKPNINRTQLFNQILNGEISDKDLLKSKFYFTERVNDRIKRVLDLALALENEMQVYKYNNNANPISKIKGDFLFKWLADDDRNVYFVLKRDVYLNSRFMGLSIFSNAQNERDFALGHTRNTLLYVSKTPLVNGEPDRSKEEVLFKRSSYNGANNGNVTIVKFAQINNFGGDVAVLAPPRFSFGQSLANLINKWADKIGEGIERRKRELQIARQENDELKKELVKRDEQLAQKDEIIKDLHAEKKDLTLELIEQKRIFREAARKTLDEKFAGAKQRCRDRKTEKPPHSLEPPKGTHRR